MGASGHRSTPAISAERRYYFGVDGLMSPHLLSFLRCLVTGEAGHVDPGQCHRWRPLRMFPVDSPLCEVIDTISRAMIAQGYIRSVSLISVAQGRVSPFGPLSGEKDGIVDASEMAKTRTKKSNVNPRIDV